MMGATLQEWREWLNPGPSLTLEAGTIFSKYRTRDGPGHLLMCHLLSRLESPHGAVLGRSLSTGVSGEGVEGASLHPTPCTGWALGILGPQNLRSSCT